MDIIEVKKEIYNLPKTSFGFSIPEIRKLAKKMANNDYEKFIEENENNDYWLRIFHAFLIGYIKADIKILLKYFEQFMPYVDDWAVNDSLCQNFKIARKYQKEVWDFLMKYKNSKKEFEIRIISVVLLSHFLNDEYIDRVIKVLDELYLNDYYSKMGVAWAFATIAGKYPDKCLAYLKSTNSLDVWTYKKTIQKIKESYKVSNEFKNDVINLVK